MIEVKKIGQLRTIKCSQCGAIIEYDNEKDTKTYYTQIDLGADQVWFGIECPQCKYTVRVRKGNLVPHEQ